MNATTEEKINELALRRQRLIQGLIQHPDGLTWCENHTDIVDEILKLLFADATTANEVPALALVATGGYGRRELSPYSDIDITVVPSDEASQDLDSTIRTLFQDIHRVFHGQLKMEIGYAYRLVADAAGLDAKTRTGLLDMRLIAGSHELVRQLENALEETFSVGEFIINKLNEREEMFRKHHDSPLVAEPHLKEGAGGLRCFHCSNWIRIATGERAARPPASYDTVVRHRNLLHAVTGKAHDLLSRHRQAEICSQTGMLESDLMDAQLDSAEQLHQLYRRAVEKIKDASFVLGPGVLANKGEVRWTGSIDGGDCAVGVAIGTRLGLHISDLQVPQISSINGPAALFALSTGEATLRNLYRCGLLAQLLPPLVAVRTALPAESTHRFSIFEHTMRAIRSIETLQPNARWSGILLDATETEPLYLALLLHDVGRRESEELHADLGADVALEICRQWELSDAQRDMTDWLIRNHLVMSTFVRSRDMQNPATFVDFAKMIGDSERLRLLTLFTYADIHAVDPNVWTAELETAMWQLYVRTLERLEGDAIPEPDPAVHRQRLLRQLKSQSEDPAIVSEFLERLPSYYLLSTPVDVVRLHMDFVRQAIDKHPTIEVFQRSDINATEITVCAIDRPGLLSRLLGVLYAYDLSVSGIRASTADFEPAVVLDVFTVSFNGKPVPAATSQQVNQSIAKLLDGSLDVDELLLQRGKDPGRKQAVIGYKLVVGSPSILEFRCPRGRGMPYRLSHLIAGRGWNVISARVGQWAGNATASFYVVKADGSSLTSDDVVAALA